MVSQLKVNEIIKQSGSSLTIGQDGDTVSGPFTNVPAFMAYKNTDQTLSDATNTKITFPATYLNVGSCFDTSTSRFTPLVAGKYYFQCTVTYECGSANAYDNSGLQFYVNGSTTFWEQSIIPNQNGNRFSEKICGIIEFNGSSDYVEVFGFHDVSTGTTKAKGHATNYRAFSFWSGFRIIGA